jgi:hypothetical protein
VTGIRKARSKKSTKIKPIAKKRNPNQSEWNRLKMMLKRDCAYS